MKGPICSICVASDMLCSACQRKLDEGAVNQLTIDVVRFLHSLEEKFKALREAEVKKVIGTGRGVVIIAASGSGGKVVGRGGAIAQELSAKFGRAKILEEGNVEDIIQNIIFPVKPIGINRVYGGKGEKYRLRIRRQDLRSLPVTKEEFIGIIKSMGIDAEIALE